MLKGRAFLHLTHYSPFSVTLYKTEVESDRSSVKSKTVPQKDDFVKFPLGFFAFLLLTSTIYRQHSLL